MKKILDLLLHENHDDFKKNNPFDKRFEEANRIRTKYPNRIPVICQRLSTNIPKSNKKKYLVPGDLTLGQFLYVIRRRIMLSSEMGIYLFVGENNSLLNNTSIINDIYDRYHDKDGFLYINYSGENTFG